MKVKDRMSKDVKTAGMDTSLTEAFRIMKENGIRRLPVMDKEKLAGIITLSDLNQAAPSSATSLSIHELNYLLARTKIKDIMPHQQNLLTIGPENYIETAAKMMRTNKISGLPVVDNGQLLGLITETDIFDALIDILGVKTAHSRIDFYVKDRPGSVAEVTGLIGEKGINILNTVMYFDEKKNRYKMILRIEDMNYQPITEELKEHGYEIESVIVSQSGEE
ncbi:MAG: CBS and ACT domain-containing protein [Syntrophomonadaceae bacterium]|nr:CBS and ACT domain-containing protein [Syntrophomonadaceae bacterium]MDD3023085.1 CBS and ACT domain-containing protein [Syntrophomonadaceae bacterium]